MYVSTLRLTSYLPQPFEAQSQSETPDKQHNKVRDKTAEEPRYDIPLEQDFFDVCYCLLVPPSAG